MELQKNFKFKTRILKQNVESQYIYREDNMKGKQKQQQQQKHRFLEIRLYCAEPPLGHNYQIP